MFTWEIAQRDAATIMDPRSFWWFQRFQELAAPAPAESSERHPTFNLSTSTILIT
jgi:hypothetical protein